MKLLHVGRRDDTASKPVLDDHVDVIHANMTREDVYTLYVLSRN